MRKFIQIFAATLLASFACLTVANAGPLTVGSENNWIGSDDNDSWTVKYFGTFEQKSYLANYDSTALKKMRSEASVTKSEVVRAYKNDHSLIGGSWATPPEGAQWIGAWNGESGPPENQNADYSNTYAAWNLPGYYAFSTTFTVEGLMEGAYAALVGQLWKDNALLGIDLVGDNGYKKSFGMNNVAPLNEYQDATDYSFKGLTDGEYTITFYIANGFPDEGISGNNPGSAGWDSTNPVALGPTGMMTKFTVDTAATPEPATLAIVGLGTLGGFIAARRRLRK